MVDAMVRTGSGSHVLQGTLKSMVLVSAATLPIWVAISGAEVLTIFGSTLLAVFAFFVLLLAGGNRQNVSEEEFDLGVEATVNDPNDSVSHSVRDAA